MTNKEINDFYQVCLDSEKWKKWVKPDFNVNNKEQLILICGHYNFDKLDMNDIDDIIKVKIKDKLKELLSYV